MRALLIALASLPLIACAENDEDALEPDEPDALPAVGDLPAIDPAHPELAHEVPDAEITSAEFPAQLVHERSTSDPRTNVPPLDEDPTVIVDPPKPQTPDARRTTTRIPRTTNTF